MVNRKNLRKTIDSCLAIGLASLVGIVSGIRVFEMKKIIKEIEGFEKVEVFPEYGEGLDSLTRKYIGDSDRYDRDLRHGVFFKDNPHYDDNLRYNQKYVIRSNNAANIRSQEF
jgi:hypothetical protein